MSKKKLDDLPVELITKVIQKTPRKEFEKLCNSSKFYRNICNEYFKELIFLHDHEVDFQDPTNFIYVANNVKIKDYKRNGVWLYKEIKKLYMKHYNKKTIKVEKKITSFPIYPNMLDFYARNNNLTTFPVQPKMSTFYGHDNKLKSFPTQPEMEVFFGNDNQLTNFPIQPNMDTLHIGRNKLTSFVYQPKLEAAFVRGNNFKKEPEQKDVVFYDDDWYSYPENHDD